MTAKVDERSEIPYRRLVGAMLAGALSWSLYFLAGYLLAEAACLAGLLDSTVAGLDLLVVVLLALGLVAALVAAYAAWWSYRRWRAGRDAREGDELATFLALASSLLNGLFTLTILVTVLSLIFVEPCSWT